MSRKPKSKDEIAPAAKPEPAPIKLPAAPLVALDGRDATVVTAAGIEAVRLLAAAGRTQNSIAASLGIGRNTLKAAFDRQEELRLAWESGNAAEEQYWLDVLRRAAAKGAFIPALFMLKARHGYRESDAPVDARPNVTIVLPDALSPDAYMRAITVVAPKITKPVDDEPRPSSGGVVR